jgi:hypothetical protein
VGPSILVLAHDWSMFCAGDLKVCFPTFLLKFLHSYTFQGTCAIDIILDKYACKEC